MEPRSPSSGVKRLDGDIRQTLRKIDRDLPLKVRKLLAELEQDLVDARIYTQAYELSETRDEQVANARQAKKWLAKAHKCILSASEYDVFGAIEVAHLSATIEQITAQLK